ncbi:unnamed protein product [Spirodela intermedia]|uniref:Uncharacterized protein n=1 Tax=Spirodela intermedia TaxID=51605 RepID=A0A7I8J6K6_SPIIN|nr:unnamed protein product [Spirodela intermedia]CAA6665741.1 unnamed protein product [Spirodela intermedia]
MQSFAPYSGSGWWTSRTSVRNSGDFSVFFLKLPSLSQRVAPRSRRLLIFSRLGRQPKRRNTLREKLLTRSDQVRKILDVITPELQHENAQPRLSRQADEQTGGVNASASDTSSMRDGSRTQNDEESVYNQDSQGKRELGSDSVLWNKLETWVDQYKKDSDIWGIGSAPIFTIYKDADGNVIRVSLNEDEIIRRNQCGTLSLLSKELREDYMGMNAKVSRAKLIAKEIESGEYKLPENSTVAQTVVEGVKSSSSVDRFHFLNPGGKALTAISPRIVLPFFFSFFVIWSLKKLLFTNMRIETTKEEKEMLRRKLKSRMERGTIEQGSVEVINNTPELPVGSERRPPLDKHELMKNIKAKTSTEGLRIQTLREMVKQVHELEQEEKQHVGKRNDESDPFFLPSTEHQLPGLQSDMSLEIHPMENHSDGSITSKCNILTEDTEAINIAGPMDGSSVGSLGNIPGETSSIKNSEPLQYETIDYPEIGAVVSMNGITVDVPAERSKMEDSSGSLDADASRNEEIEHKRPSSDLIMPQDEKEIQFDQTCSDHSSSMGKKATGIKPKVLVSISEAREYLKKKYSSSTDKLQSRLKTQDNCQSAGFLSNRSLNTVIERIEAVKSAEVELAECAKDRTISPDFSSHMALDHVQDRADSKYINEPSCVTAVDVFSSMDVEKSDVGSANCLSPENADDGALQSSVTRHFEREEVAAHKESDDSVELYEPDHSDFRDEDHHPKEQVERPKVCNDVNGPLDSCAESSEKSRDNDRQTEVQVKDEKSWVEKNFEQFDPIFEKIGVGFQENYLSAREKTKEQKVPSAGIGEIALQDEEFEWMNDENLREIVFKVRDNELAGREPFHLMDPDEKVAFFEGLERKVERENNRMLALHEFIHTKIENIDYGIDGISLHDPLEKIVPRWKGPPLSEDPEFLNNFARGQQETLESKMASEDMEDLQISDKTQSDALSLPLLPRTIIESSDGSSRSGKKLGKEHWEHTKKWSREFLELYNAETDPEVKSIMRDMGKDLDKWITEKEVQDVADLMTRIPKRKRRFIERKMDKLKREIETFGHQAVVSKYKEYLDEKDEDYLWWLDLSFVLCIELYRVEDDVPKIGFYSLEMAADLELDPKQYHVIAFEDAGDSKNFCHIIQAHMEMLGNGSAFVVARPPKDAFREAKSNGFHVTVIRKGELKLNIDQTLEEVEEEITEIGSKMYHDKIMRERGIDMGGLMKGVINADKSPKRGNFGSQ